MTAHIFIHRAHCIISALLFMVSVNDVQAQSCDPDPSLCYSTEPFPAITFGISQHFQSQANTTVYQDPLIIDTDGDCIPELILSGTTGYSNNPRKTSGITIASSTTGATLSSFPTCFYSWTNALAYAAGDINNDGIPELIIAAINELSNPTNQQGRLICYSMSGSILWISDQPFGLNTNSHYDATPALADFNQDGIPEVYCHNQVFNAQTGELILNGGANGMGINVYVSGICESSICIAGDLDTNPNDLELAAGYTIYDMTITNIHGTAGNTIVPYNISVDGTYRDGFTSLADINLDGKTDVVVSSSGTETSSRLYAYYLNASMNPVLIAKTAMPRGTSANYSDFSGPPYIGDLDGNGTPSICVTRNYRMLAYTYNGTASFQQKWILNTVDQSGCTGITSFDFDSDGIQEIVFRDENNLQILHGNGTSSTTLSSINCSSLTVNDMAIVGDIDHSGQARICVTCGSENNAKVFVYESNTSTGWAPARSIWNQYAYHVTNIENNGTVPIQQQNNAASALSNNFYIQSSLLDNNGNYLTPAADASITIDCITNNLVTGNLEIAYTLSNSAQSSKAILPGCSVSVYNGGPLTGNPAVYSTSITTSIPAGQSYSGTIILSSSLITGTNVSLLANANGTPITGSYNSTQFDQTECDYTNNVGTFGLLPVSLTAGTDLSLCSLQPITLNGTLYTTLSGTWQLISGSGTFSDIHAYNAEFTPSGTQNITLQWSVNQGNCAVSFDQVQLIFQSTPLPVIPDTVICAGDSIHMGYSDPAYTYVWDFQGQISDIHAGMPYFSPTGSSYATVTATNTATGCVVQDSFLIELADIPMIGVPADDTLCAGESIKLTGSGSAGVTLSWMDDHPNPYNVTPTTGIHHYILEAISETGCTYYDTVTITVYPSPTAAFGYSPQIILEEGQVVNTINHSENASSYSWSVNNQHMSTETNLSFTPEDHNEAAYFIRLVATNEYGCSDAAYGKVTRLTGNFVYVPNAFTPDGNEANNVFVPVFYNPEDIQDYRFEIFDRWGECVFRSSTVNESWDGTYKGKLSKDGIYTWKLQFNNVRDQEDTELTGHVTVLR